MVIWRGRPDSGPDSAILASFRVTRRQALGRLVRGLFGAAGTEVEIDDRGVRPVPGAVPGIPWEEVVDVYAERYGRRTFATLRLDSGATVRLPVPYDGCLLGHDPGFEDKLFTLRHLWETHRRWHTP